MQTASRVKLACDGEVIRNDQADPNATYGDAQAAILSDAGLAEARAAITAWPGYSYTPLHRLDGLAHEAGVGSIHYKDEGPRFSLGSFKALGGAYAVAQLLRREIAKRHGGALPQMEQILRGDHADIVKSITVCCATDGNHGRSVAWGAQTFGCNCVIFIHATVSEGRKTAIEAYGAEVRRTKGNYDDSVREAQSTAVREGWHVVSDTSYPGYTEIPKDVMQGYELMAAEADEELSQPPTHVLLQTGVGGMAAAVAAYFKRKYGETRPKIILADPVKSACWAETIRNGEPTPVHGDLDTLMAGLACGEISINAWEILRESCDAVVTVSDDDAIALMRALADPESGDTPVVAGESAVAGLGALFTLMGSKVDRAALGLGPESRVLVFGTEGDTDPELYQQLVGKTADQVRMVS